MIKVSSVWLRRAEGRTHECISVFLPSIDAASKKLREWSRTIPAEITSYFKCDFTVTFEDGEQYHGRYDLKAFDSGDLAKHMIDFLVFSTGARCPAHMTQERYDAFIASAVTPEKREACVRYLATYELH